MDIYIHMHSLKGHHSVCSVSKCIEHILPNGVWKPCVKNLRAFQGIINPGVFGSRFGQDQSLHKGLFLFFLFLGVFCCYIRKIERAGLENSNCFLPLT